MRRRNKLLACPQEWGPQADDLKRRTQVGLSWSLLSGVGGQAAQFFLLLALARLLRPEDFGLFAMASVFTGFALLLTDLGITAAIVQHLKPTSRYLSTAWWLNMLSGAGIAVVIVSTAPLLARINGEARLRPVLDVLALGFVLSFGGVHQGILERHLRFATLAKIELIAVALSACTSLVTALAGGGAWSIVVGSLVRTSVTSLGLMAVVPWLPSASMGKQELRELWSFGGRLTGFATANYWSRNFDNFLIGKQLGAGQLGIYSRAYAVMLLPINQISQIMGRVMYPSLAAIQTDIARVRSVYIRANKAMALAIFPVGIFMAVFPHLVVRVLLGPDWAGAAPILQVLALSSLPQAIGVGVSWIYQSQARTDLLFKWGLATSAITIFAFLIGIRWGTEGIAWAWTIRAYLLALPSLWLAGSLIEMRTFAVPLATWRATIASVASAGAAYGAYRWASPGGGGVALLAGLASLYTILYLVLLSVCHEPLLTEVRDAARRRLGSTRGT